MTILQASSAKLSARMADVAGQIDALREKAAEAVSETELQQIGAAIAGLRAKQEHLEAQYAEAVKSERDKATEAERKRLEKERADAIAAWRQDRADLAARWAAWMDEIQAIETRLLEMWPVFEQMQAEQVELHRRGAPLGLEVGNFDSPGDLFYRMDRRASPLRRWTRYAPHD